MRAVRLFVKRAGFYLLLASTLLALNCHDCHHHDHHPPHHGGHGGHH